MKTESLTVFVFQDKSSFVEADAAVTKEIISREKLLQTRATVLLSDTKVISTHLKGIKMNLCVALQ